MSCTSTVSCLHSCPVLTPHLLLSVQDEMERLNALEEQIMSDTGPEDERLEAIYERLEELDPTTFEARAAQLLHGLGFSKPMMAKHTKDMSGERGTTLPSFRG